MLEILEGDSEVRVLLTEPQMFMQSVQPAGRGINQPHCRILALPSDFSNPTNLIVSDNIGPAPVETTSPTVFVANLYSGHIIVENLQLSKMPFSPLCPCQTRKK